MTGTGSDAEAASGADLVLSVNSAKEAIDAFSAALPVRHGGRAGGLWADLNTASPGIKLPNSPHKQASRSPTSR